MNSCGSAVDGESICITAERAVGSVEIIEVGITAGGDSVGVTVYPGGIDSVAGSACSGIQVVSVGARKGHCA